MDAIEAIDLCDFLTDACPAQKINPGTPEAWATILAGIPLGVARVAAAYVAQRQSFVSAADIYGVVARMRTVTRRAVKRASRECGVLVDLDAETDKAIAAGWVSFAGVDLLRAEPIEARLYRPEVATLAPARALAPAHTYREARP